MPGIPHNLSTHTMNHAVEVIFHCKISGHLTCKVRDCYEDAFLACVRVILTETFV